jgi:hypothetical protein
LTAIRYDFFELEGFLDGATAGLLGQQKLYLVLLAAVGIS